MLDLIIEHLKTLKISMWFLALMGQIKIGPHPMVLILNWPTASFDPKL